MWQGSSSTDTHLAEVWHLQLRLRGSLHGNHRLLLEAADGTEVLVGDVCQRGQERGIGKGGAASRTSNPASLQTPPKPSGIQLEEKGLRGVPETLPSLPSPSARISLVGFVVSHLPDLHGAVLHELVQHPLCPSQFGQFPPQHLLLRRHRCVLKDPCPPANGDGI